MSRMSVGVVVSGRLYIVLSVLAEPFAFLRSLLRSAFVRRCFADFLWTSS